jgi:lipoyl(octanoyl) transferase
MLLNPTDLERRGIEFVQIERGGDITYHGPGQLVVYPILDMQKYSLGVKSYIDLLEETIIRVIAKYGIKGERVEGATGVWIDVGTPRERKICAIGVKCSRFVTMHGLALNVNTDLSYFSAINPCGFIDKGVTSISRELGHDIDMIEVKDLFKSIFIHLLSDRV